MLITEQRAKGYLSLHFRRKIASLYSAGVLDREGCTPALPRLPQNGCFPIQRLRDVRHDIAFFVTCIKSEVAIYLSSTFRREQKFIFISALIIIYWEQLHGKTHERIEAL